MEVPVGISWINELPRCLTNVSKEKHLQSVHPAICQMHSGKVLLEARKSSLLHDRIQFLITIRNGRFRFLAVQGKNATSRFQIGSIDLFAGSS